LLKNSTETKTKIIFRTGITLVTAFTWKITQRYATIWNIYVSHGSALT